MELTHRLSPTFVPFRAAKASRSVGRKAGNTTEIYIGFAKNETRDGRKGRIIKDDPSKYPNREDAGPLVGVVGGWAGGEAGLWKLREALAEDEQVKSSTQSIKPPASSAPKKLSPNGQDLVYLGFSKDELDLRKSGAKGRVVIDDARKYPAREDIGFIPGATGGFAGGEVALKSDEFVNTGELRLNLDGKPSRGASPVVTGLLVGAAMAGLYAAVGDDAGMAAPLDSNVRTLMLAAGGVAAASGAVALGNWAVSTAVDSVQRSIERVSQTTFKAIYVGIVCALGYLVVTN